MRIFLPFMPYSRPDGHRARRGQERPNRTPALPFGQAMLGARGNTNRDRCTSQCNCVNTNAKTQF